jgi:hypothetical protein
LVNEASGFYKRFLFFWEIFRNILIINMKISKLIIIQQTCVEVVIILQQIFKKIYILKKV